MTGRDGIYKLPRRDGTVNSILGGFYDGKGRYVSAVNRSFVDETGQDRTTAFLFMTVIPSRDVPYRPAQA